MKKDYILKYLFILTISIIHTNECTLLETPKSNILNSIVSTFNNAKNKIFNLFSSGMFFILNNKNYKDITLESIVGFSEQKEALELIINNIDKHNNKENIISFIGPDGMEKELFAYALANATQLPLIIIESIDPYLNIIQQIDDMFLFLQNNSPAIIYIDSTNLKLLLDCDPDHQKMIDYISRKIKKCKDIIFIFEFRDFNPHSLLLKKSLGSKTIVFNQITTNDAIALIQFNLQKYNLLLENDNLLNNLTNLFLNMTAKEIASTIEDLHCMLSSKKEKIITVDTIDDIADMIKNRNTLLEGNSENKSSQIITDKKLDDIWGYKSIKSRLFDLIPTIKDKNKKQKGIILSGPAGVGKTQIAIALAGSAEVNFITANPANLLSQNGAEIHWHINNLFQRAKSNTPCILFIDEIDVLLNNPIANSSFLIELDGSEELRGVTVIGATNFANAIDFRIKRSGRMSLEIKIPLPNKEDRAEIIENYLKQVKINNTPQNILNQLIERTINFNCADIKEYIYNIKTYLEENKLEEITEKILFAKYTEMTLGSKNDLLIDKKEIIQIAYHEASHGLLEYILYRQGLAANNFSFLTIEPHSDFFGVSVGINDDYVKLYTKTNIESDIKILLAGKCSQEIFFQRSDIGASSDLEKATELAHRYIDKFGMGKQLSVKRHFVSYEEERSQSILAQTEELLQKEYNLVKNFLISYKDLLEIIVKHVLEKKLLHRKDLDTIIKKYESQYKKVII
jgi:cell division protease FtsH